MATVRRFLFLTSVVILSTLTTSCAAVMEILAYRPETPPEAKIEGVSIILRHKNERPIPPGTRIVVANISGDCYEEVENAVIRRLAENSSYTILTRDNLRLIMDEGDLNWKEGRFDTRTVAKVGNLFGAALYIVGQVYYCGPGNQGFLIRDELSSSGGDFSTGLRDHNDLGDNTEEYFEISSTLQVIDVETSEVILSVGADGRYRPRVAQSLLLYEPPDSNGKLNENPQKRGDAKLPSKGGENFNSARGALSALGHFLFGSDDLNDADALKIELPGYLAAKAAEDLAANFADRFFARSTWEWVEMWKTQPEWLSRSVDLVRLGQCRQAALLLKGEGERALPHMSSKTMARYLHNYGVALLCANEPEIAVGNLHSAYRIEYNESTLRMVDLAERIHEWSLEVQVGRGSEINTLLQRVIPESQRWLAWTLPTEPESVFSPGTAERSRRLDERRPTTSGPSVQRSDGNSDREAKVPLRKNAARQKVVQLSAATAPQEVPKAEQLLRSPSVAKPPTPFNRVANISWSSRSGGGIVEIETNGLISPDSYNHVHIDGEDPRELIRLFGVAQPYELREIRLRSKVIDGIRVGYHNNSELHVVLDMLDHKSRITRTWIEGTTLRVLVE